MLMKNRFFLIFPLIFVSGKDFDIVLKLDSKQVIGALTSKTSLNYLRELVQFFAKKAAKPFMEKVNNKYNFITYKEKERSGLKNINHSQQLKTAKAKKIKNILNEEEAVKLLENPSPDGDNLDWHSDTIIEADLRNKVKKAIPVSALVKVNGVYMRRFLGRLVTVN